MSLVSNPIGGAAVGNVIPIVPALARRGRKKGRMGRIRQPNPFGPEEGSDIAPILPVTAPDPDPDPIEEEEEIEEEVEDENEDEEYIEIEAEAEVGGEDEVEVEAEKRGGASKQTEARAFRISSETERRLNEELARSEMIDLKIVQALEIMSRKYAENGGDPADLQINLEDSGDGENRVFSAPRSGSTGSANSYRRDSMGSASGHRSGSKGSKGGEMDGIITDEMRAQFGPLASKIVKSTEKVPAAKRRGMLESLKAFCGDMTEVGYADEQILDVVRDRLELMRLERGTRKEAAKTKKVDDDLKAVL